jgi:hypothetical protein
MRSYYLFYVRLFFDYRLMDTIGDVLQEELSLGRGPSTPVTLNSDLHSTRFIWER